MFTNFAIKAIYTIGNNNWIQLLFHYVNWFYGKVGNTQRSHNMIKFVLRSWRGESCTEYWLWFDFLCVGVDRGLTSRLDTFREWVFPPLTCVNQFQDECEVCEGWSVYRGGSCGHFVKLPIQGSFVRLQSFVIQLWTVFCLFVWTHDHIQKRHQNRVWNTVELDIIQFSLRCWKSESCTEYWLWCVTLCVGMDRTADVSTRHV